MKPFSHPRIDTTQQILICLLYWGVAELSIVLSFGNPGTAIVWPASGVAFAAVLRYGVATWPAIIVGSLLANAHFLYSFQPSDEALLIGNGIIAIGNLIAPLLGYYLMRGLSRNHQIEIETIRGVFLFCFVGAAIAALVAALFGAIAMHSVGLADEGRFIDDWLQWSTSDYVGILLLTPLLLLWEDKENRVVSYRRGYEPWLLTLTVLLIALYPFGSLSWQHQPLSQPFLVILPLLWAAIRFSMLATVAWGMLTFVIVWLTTSYGLGQFNFQNTAQPITAAQGFIGMVAITILFLSAVIGELRRLQQDLELRVERRTRQLAEANAHKDRIYSVIAHDLRGPASGLVEGFRAVTGGELVMDKEMTDSFAHTAGQLHQQLGRLLEWARHSESEELGEPQEVELKACIDYSVGLFEAEAQRKAISLFIEVDERIRVNVVPQVMETLVRNLLSNAIKYSHRNGAVVVRAIELEGRVRVQVEDHGVGIGAAAQAALLRDDTKPVSEAGTAGESGSGFGLLFCHDLVRRCGGSMGVESERGKGASVWFDLPYHRA